jgi:hypothetical protein
MSVLVPALASGQNPPRPPAPPTPPAPAAQTVPPVPVVAPVPAPAPMPQVVVAPTILDSVQIEEAVRAALQAGRVVDADAVRMALQQAEAARAQNDLFRSQLTQTIDARQIAEDARRSVLNTTVWTGFDLQDQRYSLFSQEADGSYESGKNYLNQKQYEQAILRFDRAIAAKGPRADGAVYWKAFAQFKLAKTDDALATIAQLRRDYDKSRYLADARVLEAEVRKPKDLAAIEDDDLLLLAINGLMNSDPPKAIPLIEGVLGRASSLKVKQRALYVLALSDQAQAHQILLNYAKGNGNPDLQREAINYLAQRRNKQTSSAELLDIYNSTSDTAIKMAVLSALRTTGASAPLVSVVNNTTAPMAIRQSALSNLTELVSPQELWNLYQKETDRDLRQQMVSIFSSMGAVDQLNQIVKTEKDAPVRQRAIRSLGNQKAERTGTTLVDIYTAEQDRDTKLAVISALATQNNADGLVSVARKETSLEIRTSIVKRLADMAPRSKAAADYLAEIIKR